MSFRKALKDPVFQSVMGIGLAALALLATIVIGFFDLAGDMRSEMAVLRADMGELCALPPPASAVHCRVRRGS